MVKFFQKNIEPNKKLRIAEIVILVLLILGSIISYGVGFTKINSDVGTISFVQSMEMTRDFEMEDYDGEENAMCDVTYRAEDKELVVTYTYEEYENLDARTITGYEFETSDGTKLYFDHQDVSQSQAQQKYQEIMANQTMPIFPMRVMKVITLLRRGVWSFTILSRTISSIYCTRLSIYILLNHKV